VIEENLFRSVHITAPAIGPLGMKLPEMEPLGIEFLGLKPFGIGALHTLGLLNRSSHVDRADSLAMTMLQGNDLKLLDMSLHYS
jgi:hypothetical protein